MKTLFTLSTALFLAASGTIRAEVPKKEDVPRLIQALKSGPTAKARASAAEDLGDRGALRASDVQDAVGPLVNALQKDKDPTVRTKAAEAIGKILPDARTAVPPLLDALKNDKAMNVRVAAARALGQLGPEAKEAVPALREIASMDRKKKETRNLVRAAGEALRAINGGKKKKN